MSAGIPTGPNRLLTVRGRMSGQPRTTPVALIELNGRRWIQSAFGEVNWVRNLRVSGEATLTRGRRRQSVIATELSRAEAAAFFGDVLTPYIRRLPLVVRSVLPSLLGLSDILKDPKAAAELHPVFELHAV
ncbi:MAG: nitroreductase family deazaflavin-dependent oxidoreductase [Candidatus Dormibacteraceae bacterium]